ncbi:hypothetical protein FQA39_LY09200 [Lamprigera yunnana]|nr:hypothetical protein FQA39_LY09200 [Lamprigera yunnana]
MDISELSNKLICETHFIPTDININNKRKLLNKNAVPVKYVEPIISVQGTIKTYGRKRKTHVKENTENSSEEDEETLAILVHSSETDVENMKHVIINNLQHRFNKFQLLLDDFETIQCEIDYLDENVNKNVSERKQFQNSYFDLIVKATEIFEKNPIYNDKGAKLLNDNTNTPASQTHSLITYPCPTVFAAVSTALPSIALSGDVCWWLTPVSPSFILLIRRCFGHAHTHNVFAKAHRPD